MSRTEDIVLEGNAVFGGDLNLEIEETWEETEEMKDNSDLKDE